MVLETDVSLLWFILQSRVRKLDVVDQHSIEPDCDITTHARHAHFVPLARWLRGVGSRCNFRKDATSDGMGIEFLFVGRITNLHFDDRPDGLLAISDVKVQPAVAARVVFVFKLALKIFAFVL